jgi:diaminohydroxyphosphoribosylaminopyrimidine deaminase/5-amino-6-(5-phosphoribosylamino)uracil reductase
MVGCVLVRHGEIVGEGFHLAAGQPHAEVAALRAAGERARGATAYVTLEPCNHHGRTPPCTDALIAAGVARVVAATNDNDPRVRGIGLARLEAAGIATSVGLLETEARALNEAFFHFHTTSTPFVTLKAAMTLDGKIATHSGSAKWITGEAARRYVHLLRARSGAVMVGIGTLLADNAQLTARLPRRHLPRQPIRIVVDSQLRTPPTSCAVRCAAPDCPLLIATTESAPQEREAALLQKGVAIVRLPSNAQGRVDVNALCAELTRRQVISVLVEGGGELNAALLSARCVQKLLFFIAPKIVGGRDAPSPVEGEGVMDMAHALQLSRWRVRHFGADVALEAYIEPPGHACRE